ncbi:MAG: FIST N-terminal domain-containing protein, partial [Pseudomonadota bacterium]
RLILARSELGASRLELPHEFALVLIDGLSRQEDQLVGCLPPGLGPVPLFGGSAGDGARFENTLLAIDGTIHRHAAVLTLVRSLSPVRVFSHDHFAPTGVRMVVTRADPANRIVSQINAEPAAAEYARLVGKDPGQLSPFTFAAHPVVVRLGGRHHVRSIQQVTPSGDLVFFSAIDEGVVLTVAEPCDMASHLSSKLEELARPAQPDALLVCDCILRRIEAGEKQMTNRISRLLSEHRVTGFSTYGEQFGAMHVNQTMTGVAFYPPGTELSA